ncbi:MAG: YlzJ-like family protein [bacterium]
MILYTIIPIDTIMEGLGQIQPEYEEISINGITVLVEQLGLTEGRIVRVISTDPQDFLNPSFQPGTMINFSPTIN